MTGPIKGDFRITSVSQLKGEIYVDIPRNSGLEVGQAHSLFWDSRQGHAVVEVVKCEERNTRLLILKLFRAGGPKTGDSAWLSGWLGESPEDFGITDFSFETLPNGTSGYLFSNRSTSWVIHVHGRRATPAETFRNLKQFSVKGFNQYSMSMKTDSRPLGLGKRKSTLGQEEWIELEQAVELAIRSGAKKIVLFGWSQGSLFIGQFLNRSKLANVVNGAIFDSPLLDYRSTMRFQAMKSKYPSWVGDKIVNQVGSNPFVKLLGYKNINVDEISLLNCELPTGLPILVLHSGQDGHVEIADVFEFAKKNNQVELVEIAGAQHCKLYNFDIKTYQTAISSWLDSNQI
jgi:pimeloyl-ACP methyl ester carboxylesterase